MFVMAEHYPNGCRMFCVTDNPLFAMIGGFQPVSDTDELIGLVDSLHVSVLDYDPEFTDFESHRVAFAGVDVVLIDPVAIPYFRGEVVGVPGGDIPENIQVVMRAQRELTEEYQRSLAKVNPDDINEPENCDACPIAGTGQCEESDMRERRAAWIAAQDTIEPDVDSLPDEDNLNLARAMDLLRDGDVDESSYPDISEFVDFLSSLDADENE